ncbi:MAG: ROK family protein, partial [Anaerolineae bacterium]|nr:ROK family protein [Anaerolineae bacterium]
MHLLGLDFGGTKLAAGLWRVGDPGLTRAARSATDIAAGAAGDLRTMLAMARRRLDDVGVERGQLGGVGISFGGHVDAEASVVLRSVHVPGWENRPLGADLAAEFGVPTVVENDANAAALAEWRFGAGQGEPSLLYLTVSTGIGGGIVLDRQVYRGRHGMAGEIGHTVVAPNGPLCPCGRRG